MVLKTRSSREERLDVFVLARKLAEDSLQDYPEDLKQVLGYIRGRAVLKLASLVQFPDREYRDHELQRMMALRQIQTLFSKNEYFSDDAYCTSRAVESFRRAEVRCRIANRRLNWYYTRRDRLAANLGKYLSRMEQDIQLLLGKMETAYPSILEGVRLTNGATEDRTRKRSFPFLKITGQVRAPRASVLHLGRSLLEMGVDLSSLKFTAVEQNTVVMVPKSCKTHRTIAKEPTHSLPFQLSLDRFLKRRLRKWGIDLSSQEKNQEMARLGSLDGTVATIDLSMASDSLCFNAVAWMLPYEWFKLFNAFRSSSYSATFGSERYAKFSSMGNGYTFTLETLIFGAACRAVGSQQYAVYGDDIAIESHLVPELRKLLAFLGFRFNEEKSFSNPDSRFRESCGCDYYKGALITPFYLRETPKVSDKPGMCHAINGLLRETFPGKLWDHLLQLVGDQKLRLVPYNYDTRSGVFVTPTLAWRRGKLHIERRPQTKGRPNPNYGLPVYEGYSMTQDVRKTPGWRSLFLWHINARTRKERAPTICPKRCGALMLHFNDRAIDDDEDENITSEIVVKTRYVHKTRRFAPVHYSLPLYLFLWDDRAAMLLSR